MTTRLRIELDDEQLAAVDRLMADDPDYVADEEHQRRAIPGLLYDFNTDVAVHNERTAALKDARRQLDDARNELATVRRERARAREQLAAAERERDELRALHAETADDLSAAGRLTAEAAERADAAERQAAEDRSRADALARRADTAGDEGAAARKAAKSAIRALDNALQALAEARRRRWRLAHLAARAEAALLGFDKPSADHDRIAQRLEEAFRKRGLVLAPARKAPEFRVPTRDAFLQQARDRFAEDPAGR